LILNRHRCALTQLSTAANTYATARQTLWNFAVERSDRAPGCHRAATGERRAGALTITTTSFTLDGRPHADGHSPPTRGVRFGCRNVSRGICSQRVPRHPMWVSTSCVRGYGGKQDDEARRDGSRRRSPTVPFSGNSCSPDRSMDPRSASNRLPPLRLRTNTYPPLTPPPGEMSCAANQPPTGQPTRAQGYTVSLAALKSPAGSTVVRSFYRAPSVAAA